MKIKMKSCVVYNGLALNIGHTFDIEDSVAKELIECKRAIKIDEPAPKKISKKPKIKAGE